MPTTRTGVQLMGIDADDVRHRVDHLDAHHVTIEAGDTVVTLNFAYSGQEAAMLRVAAKLMSFVAESDAAVSMLCEQIREELARDNLVSVGQLVDAIEGLTAHRAAQVPA